MENEAANVSRPLLSIAGFIQKPRHRVVYDHAASDIEDEVTGRRVNLRYADNL